MAQEESVESLCAADLFNAATDGDIAARATLETAWRAGGGQVTETEGYCVTPCLLSRCGVNLSLDFSADPLALRSDDGVTEALSGTCTRKKVSLDMLGLRARAQGWPKYTDHDIQPKDPDYMDL